MKMLLSVAIALCLLTGLVSLMQAQQDISPPVLVDLEIEPRQIDTRFAPATIVMTATFSDDLSGYHDAFITFRPRFSDQGTGAYFRERNFVTGTLLYGIYSDTVIVPQYSVLTRWTLQQLSIVDQIGNRIDWSPSNKEYHIAELNQYYFVNGEEYLTYLPSIK